MVGYYKLADEDELLALQSGEADGAEFMLSDENLCIDKAWHVLHYLLTGSADDSSEVIAKAVLGGEPLNEDDFGYGPILYCTPNDAREVAAELDKITNEIISDRLDCEQMLLSGVFMVEYAADEKYIYTLLEKVKSLFADAVAKNKNVCFCIM